MKAQIITAALMSGLLAIQLHAAPAARSKVFPMSDEGVACFIENMPNVETVGYPIGEDIKKVSDELYAVAEVPTYFELLSATYQYSRPMPAPPKKSGVSRNGKPYTRYVFAPPRKDTARWARFHTQWVPQPGPDDRKSPGLFFWHFETAEGPEPEQSLPIRLLPELPAAEPPKRAIVDFYTCTNCNVEPDRLGVIIDLMSRAGVNLLPFWESKAATLKKAGCYGKGIRIHVNQSGMSGWKQMKILPTDPRYRNRDRTGAGVARQDLQWVIDQDGTPWANDLRICTNYAKQSDFMTQDIEWQPVFDTGFSIGGMEAFARKFGLDASKLTPQLIWRDHRTQWGDFRAQQYLTLASYYAEAARKGNSDSRTIWLPGGPYTTTNPNLMSNMIELEKDALGRMVYLTFPFPTDRMQVGFDILQPMWYSHGIGQTKQAFAWCRAISKRVKNPLVPLFLGQGREFYYPGGDSGEVLRAMSWAALLGGAAGYGYWLTEFSPLQLSWIARTNRELSRLEDILLDGSPDPKDVAVTPLPKKTVTLSNGDRKASFLVPDFSKSILLRSFAHGASRLVGIVNLDLGMDTYHTVAIKGLPRGKYRVFDVASGKLICPSTDKTAFSHRRLAKGFPAITPSNYGISLLLIAPEKEVADKSVARITVSETQNAYDKYREPDTEGAELARRGQLVIRHDIIGKNSESAILVESPKQQVWIQPQHGAVVSAWRIKNRNRQLVERIDQNYGMGMDLFWGPADAHWSGDERADYEVIYTKIHGGKAHVRLRQSKTTPSLQGLALEKTFIIPERGTDIEVKVKIKNIGPVPEIGFSYWAHNMLAMSGKDSAPKNEKDAYPQVLLETAEGATSAPLKSIVWAKPEAPYITGNETFEKRNRNGVTTGDWIAQYIPSTGEGVLCQNEGPNAVQFYSWRDPVGKTKVSLEWMYPYVRLKAGETWSASYLIRYIPSVKPKELPKRLRSRVP